MASWLDIPEDSDFSLANIPFGVASFPNHLTQPGQPKCVTALGHHVIDLQLLEDAGAFQDIPELDANVFSHPTLNQFLEQSPSVWPQVRQRLIDLFQLDGDVLVQSNPKLRQAAIHDTTTFNRSTTTVPMEMNMNMNMKMHLPVTVSEYTDFYSSREHATNGMSVCSYKILVCVLCVCSGVIHSLIIYLSILCYSLTNISSSFFL
jgi:fumarylacetoacetase